LLVSTNSIGFDRIFRRLDKVDSSCRGKRFKAAAPLYKDKPVGALEEGAVSGLCRGAAV